MAILHRPSWLYVNQLNLLLLAPAQEVSAGQFPAVVAANRFRLSPAFNHLLQRPRHPAARQTLSTSREIFSRVKVSTTAKTRMPRPVANVSQAKSKAHS